MGRNPATGEAIKILAKTVVKMRIAKAAKEAIVRGRKIGEQDSYPSKSTRRFFKNYRLVGPP